MKKLLVLSLVIGLGACAVAIPDIEFSPGGTSPGNWIYQGTSSTGGVFTFTQQIDIDAVLGAQTDALYDELVYLPELTLSGYAAGTGVVTPGGPVEIWDMTGTTKLLSGTLVGGNYYAIFKTSTIYPEGVLEGAIDITVDYVLHGWGSAYLDDVEVGDLYDLNLTLQASANFDTMITSVGSGQNGFSGSMTVIPEPATMAILGLGSVLLLRKRT